MFLHHAFFSPEFLSDQRVRAVMRAAGESATGLVRPSDLVISAVRHGDRHVLTTLGHAFRPGFFLAGIQEMLGSRGGKWVSVHFLLALEEAAG
jgi:hypothetical protein